MTITGSGFTGATDVGFGTTSAAAMTVDSDTQITATSPAGTGTVDVTVTTPAGTSPTSPADQFTYTPAGPRSPGSPRPAGPRPAGTSVIITGSGFTGATGVSFGSHRASAVHRRQRHPDHRHQPGRHRHRRRYRHHPGRDSPPQPSRRVHIHHSGRWSPGSPRPWGPQPGGPRGYHRQRFTGATSVGFGVTSAADITVDSDTQITATSPAGTGTVDVTVTTPDGTSPASSADQFTYM